MMRCLMLPAAASLAIGSGCSTVEPQSPVVRTVIVKPAMPASAKQKCADPVILPDHDLTGKEVISYWGRDRAALTECEARRAAAVSAYN